MGVLISSEPVIFQGVCAVVLSLLLSQSLSFWRLTRLMSDRCVSTHTPQILTGSRFGNGVVLALRLLNALTAIDLKLLDAVPGGLGGVDGQGPFGGDDHDATLRGQREDSSRSRHEFAGLDHIPAQLQVSIRVATMATIHTASLNVYRKVAPG